MFKIARRVGISAVAFVIAWFVIVLVAERLFGSANFLAYVLAAGVAVGCYLAILLRDRRVA